MQTDKIRIRDYNTGREEALKEADKFSNYMGYEHKDALRVRLLVEETIGMVNTITEDFRADFWLEGKKDGTCLIHLVAESRLDSEKRKELIDASKEKKNAAYKGFSGKIRELLDKAVYMTEGEGVPYVIPDDSQNYFMMGMADLGGMPGAPVPMYNYIWTLESYRQGVGNARQSDEDAEEAWDELEKSIIANLADDICVSIKGNTAELVVEKQF